MKQNRLSECVVPLLQSESLRGNQSKVSRTFLVDARFGEMFWWKIQLCSSLFRKKTIKV